MTTTIVKTKIHPLSEFAFYKGEKLSSLRKGPYKVGTALLKNINSRELTLFTEQDEKDYIDSALTYGEDKTITSMVYYTDGQQVVSLTTRQRKIFFALAEFVDSQIKDPEIIDYINNLPDNIKFNNTRSNPLKITFDKRRLARLIYSKNDIGGKEVKAIEQDLEYLAKLRGKFVLNNLVTGETVLLNDHFLTYKSITMSKDGEIQKDLSEVRIGDIFLYGINTSGGYQLAPKELLMLWSLALNDSEVTTYLFIALLGVRGIKVQDATRKIKIRIQTMVKEGYSRADAEKHVESYKRELLTFRITQSKLLESIPEKKRYYYSTGQVRKNNLNEDVYLAKDGLKDIGLISDFWTAESASGEFMYCFLINENWLADSSKKLQEINERLELEQANKKAARAQKRSKKTADETTSASKTKSTKKKKE